MSLKELMDEKTFQRLVRVRRQIHRHPEPAFNEHKTAQVIVKYLEREGTAFPP
jgi:metal-dependent amidase/aminoacylase/carboxypeptidase family protein